MARQAAAAVAAAGIACATPASERAARSDVATVTEMYPVAETPGVRAAPGQEATLAEYLRFAMLNNPRIEAAYFAWVAEVEAITPARSLPDPRLTLESDIADTVMSLMSGLMIDLPGPGKARLAGEVQAAKSRAVYFAFEQEVLRTALALKTAYYRAHFLEESIRVQRATL